MELRVGGRYRLTRKLGKGAFGEIYHGTVYRCHRNVAVSMKDNEEVAVKLVLAAAKSHRIGADQVEAPPAIL